MAFAPGMLISGGNVSVTAAAGQTPDFFNQGVGFMNNGSLAIDTNAVAGIQTTNGFAQSPAGAFYGTTAVTATDDYQAGFRRTATGAVVYTLGAATRQANGTPQDANGALAAV